GGRHTVEDAAAYVAFAREALGTRDVDFRIRPHSDEETAFLRSHVQGRPLEVTYADLDRASAVLLVAFEPEEESPIVFLRLREAVEVGLLPQPGARDTSGIVAAAAGGDLDALVVGAVDPADLPDPALAAEAFARVPFLVSLEQRQSAVTSVADVVLPVSPVSE